MVGLVKIDTILGAVIFVGFGKYRVVSLMMGVQCMSVQMDPKLNNLFGTDGAFVAVRTRRAE